jgi:tetratricopeptide (TPR) repeat protein
MKKIKRIMLVLAASCICLCMAACSRSDNNDNNDNDTKIEEIIVYEVDELSAEDLDTALADAFTFLTAGRFEDAVTFFNDAKTRLDAPNIALEIGLGRASFMMEDYSGAQKAFEAALKIDPTREDIQRYLGEAFLLAGDYADSAIVFRNLFDRNPDDISNFSRLEQSLRSGKDYNGLILLYEERIESADEDDEGFDLLVNTIAVNLIEAAQLIQDYDLLNSLVDRFSDFYIGPAAELGLNALKLLNSGDIDDVRDLLFNQENAEILDIPNHIYFGSFNEYGEYEGEGFTIGASRIYFGEFAANKPNGTGTGYITNSGEWDNDGTMIRYVNTRIIEANWQDGFPGGNIIEVSENFSQTLEGVMQNYRKTTTTLTMVNGLAQGEHWQETEYRWYNRAGRQQGRRVDFVKHVLEDGEPIPFEVTRRGRTVMAYEAWYNNPDGNTTYVNENECAFCNFDVIW